MSIGIVGRKVGMTRVFSADGAYVPVTVIHVDANRVTQVRRVEKEGYRAAQVTCGQRKASRLSKPAGGHFVKAGVEPGRGLWELRFANEAGEDMVPGAELTAATFAAGQRVDVSGVSKGKGFAGTIKRHNFRGQDSTHGNSRAHRVPGSIGQCQTPGRVFKGKKMAGHMGHVRCTSQNLEVVRVDPERSLLLLKGAIPGPRQSDVVVRPSVKRARATNE